ncbi:MAG: right-handed parallel beta-helix repeat-containing protein [Verrucomicrobia bacterium]|nr:right-handed parallel beta-helix repeat-containing protein [Verrucomicrobiota bacterium]
MKKLPHLRFRDAFLLSLPIVVLLAVHVFVAVKNFAVTSDLYHQVHVRTLKEFARKAMFGDLADLWVAKRVIEKLDPDRNNVENIFIDVSANELEQLYRDLPDSGDQWVDVLLNGQRARMSLRGSVPIHWLGDPRSFHLRTPKTAMFRNRRDVLISVKQIVPQHAAYRIAEAFDVHTPDSRVVNIFLNGKYYAPLHLVERIDDVLMIRRRAMPGALLSGENHPFLKNDFPGLERWLFRNPYVWEVEGAAADKGRDVLMQLTRALADPATEISEIESFFDLDEMARFLAALLVSNEFHVDNWHNQRFHYDPINGKLHPIFWDTSLQPLELDWSDQRPVFTASYKLAYDYVRLLSNPALMQKVFAAVDARLGEGGGLSEVVARVKAVEEKYQEALFLTRRKFNDRDGNAEILAKNLAEYEKVVEDARFKFSVQKTDEGSLVIIEAAGHIAGRLEGFRVKGAGKKAGVWQDMNFNGKLDEDDDIPLNLADSDGVAGFSLVLSEPLDLVPGFRFHGEPRAIGSGIRSESLFYPFIVRGVADTEDIELILSSVLSGRSATVEKVDASDVYRAVSSIHPWKLKERPPQTIAFTGGVVRLDQNLVLGPRDELSIEPGTKIEMSEGVSLVARCRVDWHGEAGAPIAFVPADPALPFGVVALQGHGADGSRIEHVHIEGGSRADVENVLYTGSLSIFGVSNVVVKECTFGRNFRGDDMLRSAYSHVTVRDCAFTNARSDAIDYDYSSGAIDGCVFVDTGNDAIDLMTCSPLIVNNEVRKAGDKGVSIGNDSRPVIVNNLFDSCAVGIETKDESEPVLFNNVIRNCETGIHGYMKNWRYGRGGKGRAYNCIIVDNSQDILMESGSQFQLHSCAVTDADDLAAARDRVLARVVVGLSEEKGARARIPGGDPAVLQEVGVTTNAAPIGLLESPVNVRLPQAPVDECFFEGFDPPPVAWKAVRGVRRMKLDGRRLRFDCARDVLIVREDLPDAEGMDSGILLLDIKSSVGTDWTIVLRDSAGVEILRRSVHIDSVSETFLFEFDGGWPSTLEIHRQGGEAALWIRSLKLLARPN